ncbi:SgcJ/EcaC family oxidoreductase [Aestuariivirga sp.]|uniref:SgcJ/EcaC family oxidoreductase n=1 Tax=Aestuariivirga sp. TaxID=2650926 RepID=UPI003BABC10F
MINTSTIESLKEQWIEAFNAHDLDRHMELYTVDAMLFGAVDALQNGRDAIRAYFGNRPAGMRVAAYPDPVIRHSSADVAVTAAHVDFFDGQQLMPYRLTWTLVRIDGNWRIAQHHGSPRRGE